VRASRMPGSRTDRLVSDSIAQDHGDHWVIDTPACRASSWGHRLVLDERPTDGEALDTWFERWAGVHAGKGVTRAYLSWEAPAGAVLPEPLPGESRFVVRQFAAADAGPWPEGVRALGPDDGGVVRALMAAGTDEGADAGAKAYAAWAWAVRAGRLAAGRAVQLGAFEDGALVATAAVLWDDHDARYQDVVVHPDHRRRGWATRLVEALRGCSPHAPYITAVVGSPADGIYERLQGVFVGHSVAWDRAGSPS